jgi:hypothetical protein
MSSGVHTLETACAANTFLPTPRVHATGDAGRQEGGAGGAAVSLVQRSGHVRVRDVRAKVC